MKNMLMNTVAVILATGIVIVGIIAALSLDIGGDSDSRTLSVQGEATQTFSADEVEIRFSVLTEADSADAASQGNADKMSAVVAALEAFGDVETQGYSVEPVYDYGFRSAAEERDLRIQFYRARNTVVLKTTDLSAVGDAIDAATRAGANSVNGLSFQLSDARREELRSQLLAQASQNARGKADAIASGLGVEVEDIKSVNEGNVYFPTYARAYDMAESVAAGSAPTPVKPGTIEVSASVSVTYEIG